MRSAAANNLLAAALEAHILHGNKLGIDPLTVGWRRCVDVNDRSLRQITLGLGGRANGYPRESGFDITAASEVMAIVAVSNDLQDLRRRLGAITVGFTYEGEPVTADQLQTAGAMAVILKEALKPNLIQTLEGQACFMHCGPFANIAHGNNSLVADKVGLKLGDICVTESGFALGHGHGEVPRHRVPDRRACAERCRRRHDRARAEAPRRGTRTGARRASSVAPRTCSATSASSRSSASSPSSPSTGGPEDTDEECEVARKLALDYGAYASELNEAFAKGGDGATALAEAVVGACEQPNSFAPVYGLEEPIADKIEKIATRVYGADGIQLLPAALEKIERYTKQGLDSVPICMAKTHLSLSHDPTLVNAPTGFHAAGARPARLYGLGLDRRALRRHADDARPRRHTRAPERRHRRRRQDARAVLGRNRSGHRPADLGRKAAKLAAVTTEPCRFGPTMTTIIDGRRLADELREKAELERSPRSVASASPPGSRRCSRGTIMRRMPTSAACGALQTNSAVGTCPKRCRPRSRRPTCSR